MNSPTPATARPSLLDAWMEQETASDSDTMQLSEWTMSSTPYIARRLKLMREWAATPHLRQWRAAIEHVLPPEPATPAITAKPSAPAPTPTPDSVRLVCPKCKTGLLVPRQLIESKDVVNVRCPNRQCGNVLAIRKKAAAEPPRQTEADSDE